MPTAEKFAALGRGNGFPFCAPTVDVSAFDYYVTLGGTAKGSTPTELEKTESLKKAMQLYWNSSKFRCFAFHQGDPDFTEGSIDEVPVKYKTLDYTDSSNPVQVDSGLYQPKDRLCDSEFNGDLVTNFDIEVIDNLNSIAKFDISQVTRMVNASGEFLGYGLGQVFSGGFNGSIRCRGTYGSGARSDIAAGSYGNADTGSFAGTEFDAGYYSIDGFPFVLTGSADNLGEFYDRDENLVYNSTGAVNLSTLSVSSQIAFADERPTRSTGAGFSGIEFYEY